MRLFRAISFVLLILMAVFAVSACSQSSSSAPVPTSTKPAEASEPTKAAAGGSQTNVSSATATAVPEKLAVSTPAASGVSVADLVSKARGMTEFSCDIKSTVAGQTVNSTVNSKMYLKGTKMRQEMTVAGIKTVILIDLMNKVAYSLLADQKTALKMDFSQLADKAQNPSDTVTGLPSDAKLDGTETIDGKLTTVYEYSGSDSQAKIWVWTEKGVPLKSEVTVSGTKVSMEYSNYQFGGLDDSLFVLPPGTTVTDLPIGLGGNLPTPPKP